MDAFLQVVISNSLLATILAVVAGGCGRFRANPAVVHVLLLMVLVKLFTPPILLVGVPLPAISANVVVPEGLRGTEPILAGNSGSDPAFPPGHGVASWQQLLFAIWITGTVMVAVRYVIRIRGIRRLLRQAGPVPSFLEELAEKQCSRMGIARCPRILCLPIHIMPAVWSLGGRPRIVFPTVLIKEMDRNRLETILAHELAHVRRKDYFVRFGELAAMIVFWWHPIVWWTRRKLREMEERACDALVLKAVSHGERTYATALIETLEFLNRRPGPLPIVATTASPTASLERRFEMMKSGFHRTMTIAAMLVGTAVCLPTMMVALAAEPSKDADQEQNAHPRVLGNSNEREDEETKPRILIRDSRPGEGKRRIIIRYPDGENAGRTLFLDPEGNGAEPKVILRNSDDGETGKMLFLDPEGNGDERKVIRRNSDFGETGKVLFRDFENAEGGRKIIIHLPELEGLGYWLFSGSAREGDEPVIIRRSAPQE